MVKKVNKRAGGGSIGRAKPLTPKNGVTKSGTRRDGSGGKIKKSK